MRIVTPDTARRMRSLRIRGSCTLLPKQEPYVFTGLHFKKPIEPKAIEAEWDEAQHPRGKDGKFGEGNGADEEPTKAPLPKWEEVIPAGMKYKDALKAFPDPSRIDPTWVWPKNWSQQAYGGVLVNRKGEFLLREPSKHFDGYAWTWPKGKMDDKHEHPITTALREVEI